MVLQRHTVLRNMKNSQDLNSSLLDLTINIALSDDHYVVLHLQWTQIRTGRIRGGKFWIGTD